MENKIDIASDIVSGVLIKEVRGISTEVREWSLIIKNVIESEYKKYWNSFNKTYQNKKKGLKKEDLGNMGQDEVNNIVGIITKFYGLRPDQIEKLNPEEIVTRYNRYLNSVPKEHVVKDSLQKPPSQIIINGKDYLDAYKSFSVDKWIITDQEGRPMEYDHINSGYDPSGEYIVYINAEMSSKVSSFILVHEIKHAYQDWQRMSKNKSPIRQSKEIQELYTKDFERYVLAHPKAGFELKTIESVIAGYYISSEFEITAYIESVYDAMHDTDYENRRNSEHLSQSLRNAANNMINFTPTQVSPNVKPEELQQQWVNIITEYDIPMFRKFKNIFDFLKYTEKIFKKRGKYIITKIDKLETLDVIENKK